MADISLEAVAGKLNRVGYEAFFKALRQAKGAGNRNVELAHWLAHILQSERTDIGLTADHFKLDRGRLMTRCHRGGQRLPQERDRDAGGLQHRHGSARPRLALRHVVLRRDPDPHRSSYWSARCSRANSRAPSPSVSKEFAKISVDALTSEYRKIWAGSEEENLRPDGRLGAGGRRHAGGAADRAAPRARPRSTASPRISPPRRSRARWIRSSAATRKSGRSSTC